MKVNKLLIAFFVPLLITACSSGGHFNSKNNPIASLFNQSDSNSELSQSVSSFDNSNSESLPTYDHIDIDLTSMNSTMVYSEVLNMLTKPEQYVDKVVKAAGPFVVGSSSITHLYYPAVLIQDATACCSGGLEFLLYGVPRCTGNGGNGYPLPSEQIVVVGTFKTYLEGSGLYVHLEDAIWLRD